MRLFEVTAEPRKVVATKRFEKELAGYLKADPKIGQTLAAFLRFRETALPQQAFSKKDVAYTGGQYKGLRHVHLSHGRVILTYDITGSEIRLISVHNHSQMDAAGGSLHRYTQSVGDGDFSPFAFGKDDQASNHLTPEQKQAALDALYDFASHPEDRKMMMLTAQGEHVEEMWEMIRVMVEAEDAAVIQAFGGPNAFAAKVSEILRQTA